MRLSPRKLTPCDDVNILISLHVYRPRSDRVASACALSHRTVQPSFESCSRDDADILISLHVCRTRSYRVTSQVAPQLSHGSTFGSCIVVTLLLSRYHTLLLASHRVASVCALRYRSHGSAFENCSRDALASILLRVCSTRPYRVTSAVPLSFRTAQPSKAA